jgi:hypothetical protein
MTAKKQAEELHANMYKIVSNGKASHNPYMGIEYIPDLWETAKSCALAALDKMIDMCKLYHNHNVVIDTKIYTELTVDYWKEVKQEIESL